MGNLTKIVEEELELFPDLQRVLGAFAKQIEANEDEIDRLTKLVEP